MNPPIIIGVHNQYCMHFTIQFTIHKHNIYIYIQTHKIEFYYGMWKLVAFEPIVFHDQISCSRKSLFSKAILISPQILNYRHKSYNRFDTQDKQKSTNDTQIHVCIVLQFRVHIGCVQERNDRMVVTFNLCGITAIISFTLLRAPKQNKIFVFILKTQLSLIKDRVSYQVIASNVSSSMSFFFGVRTHTFI